MRWDRRFVATLAVLTGASMHAEGRAAQRPVADVKFASPQHQIVVQVTLGKQGPFSMLLETGTDPSVIDVALARRLRAISDAAPHAGEGVEPARANTWDMVDFGLGHMRADTVAAVALDLGRLSDQLGMHVDGVLGYGFLRGRIVQIDYRRHRVRFYRDTPPWSGSESVELEMTLDPGDPTPGFAGRINRRDVLLLYDSGSRSPLAVVGRSIVFLGLKAAFETAAPDSAFGEGGRAETRKGRVPSVEIGQIRFTDVPCVFGVQGHGESWDRGTPAGTIGGALLDGMVVTLDYPRRSIRFER